MQQKKIWILIPTKETEQVVPQIGAEPRCMCILADASLLYLAALTTTLGFFHPLGPKRNLQILILLNCKISTGAQGKVVVEV